MARIQLSEGFTLIPEGEHVFKIMEVDDSKYEDFGKLKVTMQTKEGNKHFENFSFYNGNEMNEGAVRAFSYFAKTALNNPSLEEIDSQDIAGCYIAGTVKHEEYTDNNGNIRKAERMNNWKAASGFESVSGSEETPKKEPKGLLDFLNSDD